jgi:hypothetical protein
MNKCTFAFGKDSKGREFVYQKDGEADKNHGADNSVNDTTGEGLMYSQPQWGEMCPVSTYRKYLSKLHPSCSALWQRPLDSFVDEEPIWYANMPVGVNPLGKMIPQISELAGLSQIYTNHCIRSTTITTLDQAGVEARHIMRISGHR